MILALGGVVGGVLLFLSWRVCYIIGYEDGARSVDQLLDRARWEDYGRQVHGG